MQTKYDPTVLTCQLFPLIIISSTHRLSKVAGDKMSANNPDLADLSDPYRPTRLAESFSQLYDDEWTHAYEDLQRKIKSERDVIETLAKVLKVMKIRAVIGMDR